MEEVENIIEYNYAMKYDKLTTINICYGIDNNYVRCLATSIISIILNNRNRDIIFHIVSNDISDINKDKLKILSYKYNLHVKLYKVKKNVFENLPKNQYWSKAMYFRFIMPRILKNVDKIFYFDADIICLKNVGDFFDVNLENNIIAAVTDIKRVRKLKENVFNLPECTYFNSGMMVINIKKWNEFDVFNKVLNYLKDTCNKYKHPDQDVLNIVLNGNVKYLDTVYNCIDVYSVKFQDIIILHLANHPKPWNKFWFLNVIYNKFTADLYNFYELKTPFKNMETETFKNHKDLLKWFMKYILFKPIKRV